VVADGFVDGFFFIALALFWILNTLFDAVCAVLMLFGVICAVCHHLRRLTLFGTVCAV
jgi:hypothetical protein